MVLKEIIDVPYAGYYCCQKTVVVAKKDYYWPRMKKEIPYYISICLEFSKVKFEHRHVASLLQPLHILEWELDVVSMDLIMKLPKTRPQLLEFEFHLDHQADSSNNVCSK